jgi:hypothetical protein
MAPKRWPDRHRVTGEPGDRTKRDHAQETEGDCKTNQHVVLSIRVGDHLPHQNPAHSDQAQDCSQREPGGHLTGESPATTARDPIRLEPSRV